MNNYGEFLKISKEVAGELQTFECKRDLEIAYSKVGSIFEMLGYHEEALKMYKEALKLDDWLTKLNSR